MSEPSIFTKIINREIPGTFEHEDDLCVAIRDINPQAPVHILIIPKKHVVRTSLAEDDDQALLGHLLLTARNVAKKLNLEEGFRIVINNGPQGGEAVPHLHVHLLAGRQMSWPPG
ncbi:MAG: histidine triad nucleotide-binding protein [Verrucomicrobia bacterium]|nr:histidine triad nucleotide-binding protein [Verrucomicrobiota bacterium]